MYDLSESALTENTQALLAAIVESSDDAIVSKTLEGIITSWNRGAERLLGYSSGEIVGKPIMTVVPPDLVQEEEDILARLRTGEHIRQYETVRKTKDGRLLDISLSVSPLYDNSGRMIGISSIARNISERKAAQRKIGDLNRQLQERVGELQTLLEVLPAGVFMAHDPRCERITTNPFGAELLRLPSPGANASKTGPDAANLGFRVLKDGKELTPDQLPLQRCTRTGEPVRGEELEIVFDDGSVTHTYEFVSPLHDERGQIRGCVGAFVDITERIRAEEALRRSESNLSDFFDNATLGLHWVGPDGVIVRANRAELHLLGYDEDEYVGHHIAEFHVDRNVMDDILARLFRGETIQGQEARLRCKDGSIKHVLIDSNVLWENGEFVHTRCFTRDVTAERQAELALQKSEQNLRELNESLERRVAERTRSLQRQTTRLRHLANELSQAEQRERNKLARLLHDGLQQLLVGIRMHVVNTNGPTEAVDRQRTRQLVDDAIELTRSLAYELSPPVLRHEEFLPALEWLAAWFSEHHRFTMHVIVSGSIPPLGEPLRIFLFEAVRELILNAVKYSGQEEAYVTMSQSSPDTLRVEVRDAGRGFNPKKLESSSEVHDGWGLFSIRQRLHALGGTLDVDSGPGRGATFVITLAADVDAAVAS